MVVGAVQLPLRLINSHASGIQNMLTALVYFLGFALAILVAGTVYFRNGYRKIRRVNHHDWWLIIRCYLSALVIEIILNSLNLRIYHQASSKNNVVITKLLMQNRTTLVILTISMVCLSPILEELIFRGFLMDSFFGPKYMWWPIIISSLPFALGHLTSNLVSFSVYVVMGMFLAYVYRKSNNLLDSILMHALNNLVSVILLLITFLP